MEAMALHAHVLLSNDAATLKQRGLCDVNQSELDGLGAFMESKMPSFARGQAYSIGDLYAQYIKACTSNGTSGLPLHSFKIILTDVFKSQVQILADTSSTLEVVLLKTMSVITELNELASLKKSVRNSKGKFHNSSPLSSTLVSFHSSALLFFEFLKEINFRQNGRVDTTKMKEDIELTHSEKGRSFQGFNKAMNCDKNGLKGSIGLNKVCLAYESLFNFLHILIKGCYPDDNQELMDSVLFEEIGRLVEELARLQLLYRKPSKAADEAGGGVRLVYKDCEHALFPLPSDLSVKRLVHLIKVKLSLPEDSEVCVSFYDDCSQKHLVLDNENVKCVEGKTLLVELSGTDSSDSLFPWSDACEESSAHSAPLKERIQQNLSEGDLGKASQNNPDDDHSSQSPNHCDDKDELKLSKAEQRKEDSHDLSTSGSVDEEGLWGEDDKHRPHSRAKKKERCSRTALLPPNFELPLHIFPPALLTRISQRQELHKADLCEVITTVFRHVVCMVPYPTRGQYCQIINALFRTLPQLLHYSSSYDEAYSEWKYRLSHKFRNCRRKNKCGAKRQRRLRAQGHDRHLLACADAPDENSDAAALHQNENHNLTLAATPLSLDALLGLLHRHLDIPQYVALRVQLRDGAQVTPVTQHNVHMVSGRHLIVEIDDHSSVELPELSLDALLGRADGNTKKVSVKIEPFSQEENGCVENEMDDPSFSSAGITEMAGCDTSPPPANVGCEPDINFLSPSTRIEIEEDDLKDFNVAKREGEEIDLGETFVDFNSIENCELDEREVMHFGLERSDQFPSDYGDNVAHEFVSMEDLKREAPESTRKKRRYRCRGAPLPPDFSVPASVFPPPLAARVSRGLPLSRADLCRITSALFGYVVTRLPYPSPNQYSEIISALFTSLPGLLAYSDCLETAHSEWKYRLSHKFRNFRRKKNNKTKSRSRRGKRTPFHDNAPSLTDEYFPHDDSALSLWANESIFPFGPEEALRDVASALRCVSTLRAARAADEMDCLSGQDVGSLRPEA